MANLLAKSKKYILCFLAAVALIFGVTGTAMLSDGRSVSAAETQGIGCRITARGILFRTD